MLALAVAAISVMAPRVVMIDVPPTVRAPDDPVPSSRIIFLHRCGASDCAVRPGTDDSRTGTSSITQGATLIGAFTEGDDVWAALVACMTATYSPFALSITEVDPGDVPHFEVMVGGQPGDLRDDLAGAAGVSPFTCAEIPNSISFTFDDVGPDANLLCWTAAQEAAHGFGLDHELLQPDPMTYIPGDYPKRFQPVVAPCGEYTARVCRCGTNQTTQDSFASIEALFGPGDAAPPTVAIAYPADGATVTPSFELEATAEDDITGIASLALFVDGTQAGSSASSPWFVHEIGLAAGTHALQVVAYDANGTPATANVTVTVGPPCDHDGDCADGGLCASGECVAGADRSGGLGAQCENDGQCLLDQCVSGPGTFSLCSTACETDDATSCPGGFDCIATGNGDHSGACWPVAGGCCDAGGGGGLAPLLFGAGTLAWLVRRRRS